MDDLEACQRFARMEIDNSGRSAVEFLELDDPTAIGPRDKFGARMAEQIDSVRRHGAKAKDAIDAFMWIGNAVDDLRITALRGQRTPTNKDMLDCLVEIAAQCQRCAEDLGLIEGEVIDPSFVEIP